MKSYKDLTLRQRELISLLIAEGIEPSSVSGLDISPSAMEALRTIAKSGLVQREADIVLMAVVGITKKRIAEQLFISPRTVGTHVQNAYKKLKVHSQTELIFWAIKAGLIEP